MKADCCQNGASFGQIRSVICTVILTITCIVGQGLAAHGDDLYVTETHDGFFARVDSQTGVATVVGLLRGGEISAMAYDDVSETYYAFDGEDDALYSFHHLTLQTEFIMVIPDIWHGRALTWVASEGALYGCDALGKLFIVDVKTQTVTYLQIEGAFTGIEGLAYRPQNDTLYGIADDQSRLVTIDRKTGVATEFANLAAGHWVGLTYDPKSDQLFAMRLHNYLASIDPETGLFATLPTVKGIPGAAQSVLAIPIARPANDDCNDALEARDGMTTYSTVDATTDGPLEVACGFPDLNGLTNDVWFRYVATCTGVANAGVCDSTFNNSIVIYDDACPIAGNSAVACDENGCGTSRASVSFDVIEGSEYWIRIAGKNGQTGTGVLEIVCDETPPCVGDFDGSGEVDVIDMLSLLSVWGECPDDCVQDINYDLFVDVVDLLTLLYHWGPCS